MAALDHLVGLAGGWRAWRLVAMIIAVGMMGRAWANPHQHGTAHASLMLEGTDVTISLTVPLDSLLGYEDAPRSDRERRIAEELLTWMRQGELIFQLEASSPCSLIRAMVQAPVLELPLLRLTPGDTPGVPVPGTRTTPKAPGHHDLQAQYVFACATPEPPKAIRTLLFSSFKRLERVELSAVMPHGTVKGTMRRGAETLALTRPEPKRGAERSRERSRERSSERSGERSGERAGERSGEREPQRQLQPL